MPRRDPGHIKAKVAFEYRYREYAITLTTWGNAILRRWEWHDGLGSWVEYARKPSRSLILKAERALAWEFAKQDALNRARRKVLGIITERP